jgi:uncharacterized protein DUF1592/uncharacterized protein DUF1588/uncharacterized protein DUF1595/uncharacterized protein DUF1585/uncharacterized protein DUF1587
VIYFRTTFLSGLALLLLAPACSHESAAPAPPPRTDGYVPTPKADLTEEPLTPRRLRRLTNREMGNVLADVLGNSLDLTKGFLRDSPREGYDNDWVALVASESKVDEVAAAAERAGVYLTAPERLDQFAPCPAGDLPACARSFAASFAARAWGHTPSSDELDRLGEVFRIGQDGGAYAAGIELIVEAVLQSPSFVYRTELGEGAPAGGRIRLSAPEIASAMSFALTGSRPDVALLAAAAAGDLLTPEGREGQARRLLETPAARRLLRVFLRAWLRLTDVATINKDLGVYPVFTPKVRYAMDHELDLFLDHVLGSSGRLDELMVADYAFPSPDLGPIYNDDLIDPVGNFTEARLDTRRRRGILSSPAFLATHALIDQTNPIQRGLMVRVNLLCHEVLPPPSGVPPAPAGMPGVTTRSKYTEHSKNSACRGCHLLLDPIGFGFESFDTLGRYRIEENGQPVDASGELLATDIDGPFTGPAELSARLPKSAQFRRCFVRQLWRFTEGRAAEGGDDRELDGLAWKFEQADHRIGDLLVDLIKRPTFILRRAAEGGP